MVQTRKFVAILTSSPALSSIIAMVLDCEEFLNVQNFEHMSELQCHMRIAPVDLIICDYRINNRTAPQLKIALQQDNPHRQFETIMLTDYVSGDIKQACKFAAIDEVIIKPMSPLFLRDRVLARLNKTGDQKSQNRSVQTTLYADNSDKFHQNSFPKADNVINLFSGTTP